MSKNLDCTIVILSYNSLKVTDTCLVKVETALTYTEKTLHNHIEVIVVDNASSDGSVAMIKSRHPTVRLEALTTNIGYARGNNYAMKLVKTPYILLMNSDTYVNQDSLVKTLTAAEAKSNCDVLVSRCLTAKGELQRNGGHLPTPFKLIRWAAGFESLPIIKNMIRRIYSLNLDFYTKDRQVEWYPPCFFLLKKRVFDLTGGFDPELFFHMVDVEWCFRMRQHRLVICYTPTIDVIHLGGASSQGLEAKLFMDNFKGLFHYCKKHYPQNAKLLTSVLRIGLRIRSFFYAKIGKSQMAAIYKEAANLI